MKLDQPVEPQPPGRVREALTELPIGQQPRLVANSHRLADAGLSDIEDTQSQQEAALHAEQQRGESGVIRTGQPQAGEVFPNLFN